VLELAKRRDATVSLKQQRDRHPAEGTLHGVEGVVHFPVERTQFGMGRPPYGTADDPRDRLHGLDDVQD
jgi:hypothetical protein